MLIARIQEKTEELHRLSTAMGSEVKKKVEVEERLARLSNDLESHLIHIHGLKGTYHDLVNQREGFNAEISELWSKDANFQSRLRLNNEELTAYAEESRSMAGIEIFDGWTSVMKVLESLKAKGRGDRIVKGYHGLVLENIRAEAGTEVAVEITAGKRLYYHIVETEEHGSLILKEFKSLMLPGEINFIALDSVALKSGGPNLTMDPMPTNIVEMVRVIKHEEKFTKVIRHIFGKTLICKELDATLKIARSQGFDCVTLDGYKIASTGVWSGSCSPRSRLKIQIHRGVLQKDKYLLKLKMSEVMKSLRIIEGSIKKIGVALQENSANVSEIMIKVDEAHSYISMARENINSIEHNITLKEQSIDELKSNLEALQTTKKVIESEFSQDMRKSLFHFLFDKSEQDSKNDENCQFGLPIEQLPKKVKQNLNHPRKDLDLTVTPPKVKKDKVKIKVTQDPAAVFRCGPDPASKGSKKRSCGSAPAISTFSPKKCKTNSRISRNCNNSKISIKPLNADVSNTIRPMSYDEMDQLFLDINKLSSAKVSAIVDIINARNSSLLRDKGPNEIEMDFRRFGTSLLRELQTYVASCKNNE